MSNITIYTHERLAPLFLKDDEIVRSFTDQLIFSVVNEALKLKRMR